MGMYTATADPAQWLATFGVDVEHIDQGEIVRLAAEVPEAQVDAALRWLEENVGHIHYDGRQLTQATVDGFCGRHGGVPRGRAEDARSPASLLHVCA